MAKRHPFGEAEKKTIAAALELREKQAATIGKETGRQKAKRLEKTKQLDLHVRV